MQAMLPCGTLPPRQAPMNSPARLVWLFDVDGTLLTTDGASREVFGRVVARRVGGREDLSDIDFAGRTDPLILADILRSRGAVFDAEDEARFWDAIFDGMGEALGRRGRLLPGVVALLDALSRRNGWVTALLTGNMTQMAAVKLRHFGVRQRFVFGAFGEEGPDRNAVARVAVSRAAEYHGVPPERCIVLGDTEHDIDCARAAGAAAVSVATGARSRESLAALGPDLLLDDFDSAAELMEWAEGLAGR